MGERIFMGMIGGFTLLCLAGSIAGIVISTSGNHFPAAETKIQDLKNELPKKSSLTLPVNGN